MKNKSEPSSLNKVYENNELVYYCNACGEINIPETDPLSIHNPDELPLPALNLYENYWREGAGLTMYVVKYKGQFALAVAALFDDGYRDDLLTENGIAVTDTEFFDAVMRVAKMYKMAFRFETLVGQDTDPDGHEIVFIIPYDMCDGAQDIAAFVGDHIYTDFEQECYMFHKNRMKKGERIESSVC